MSSTNPGGTRGRSARLNSDGFVEDMRVALHQPRINAYQIENNGRVTSGISFKAAGLAPAGPAPAPRGEK
jgi:hypothetical protein